MRMHYDNRESNEHRRRNLCQKVGTMYIAQHKIPVFQKLMVALKAHYGTQKAACEACAIQPNNWLRMVREKKLTYSYAQSILDGYKEIQE